MTSDAAELQMALALSASLQQAEQIQDIQEDLDKATKAQFFYFPEDKKESLENTGLISDQLSTESYTANLKKRKLNNSTTLQLSNPEIKDRILTKNLAKILIEHESVGSNKAIFSWNCVNKMERVVQQNNCLQKYHFVGKNFWNLATFWNQNMPNYVFEEEFITTDVNEEKSSALFELIKNNIQIETTCEQYIADTHFSKTVNLGNDYFTALRQKSEKSTNSKPLTFHGEVANKEKREVLYEGEANEQHEYLNILSNLVNISSLNEDVHKFLKRHQLLRLEAMKNMKINSKNASDLEYRDENLFNENTQEFCFDNKNESNKGTGKIEMNFRRHTDLIDSQPLLDKSSGSCQCGESLLPKRTSDNWESSAMQTLQLKGDLRNFGLKILKPHSAMRLLHHIRVELEPVKSASDEILPSSITFNIDNANALTETNSSELCRNNSSEYDLRTEDCKLMDKTKSQAETGSEMDFKSVGFLNEDSRRLNSKNILASSLISNSELLKKIFKYQPLELNVIRIYLKDQGVILKNNSLMTFLNEQSITFFTDSNKEKAFSIIPSELKEKKYK